MSWYLLPNGRPWYAVDGSSLARRVIDEGATVLDDTQVAAALAAWATHTPGPAGTPATFVTYTQLQALLTDLTPGGGGNALPDPADGTVLVVQTGGGWSIDPTDDSVLIAA